MLVDAKGCYNIYTVTDVSRINLQVLNTGLTVIWLHKSGKNDILRETDLTFKGCGWLALNYLRSAKRLEVNLNGRSFLFEPHQHDWMLLLLYSSIYWSYYCQLLVECMGRLLFYFHPWMTRGLKWATWLGVYPLWPLYDLLICSESNYCQKKKKKSVKTFNICKISTNFWFHESWSPPVRPNVKQIWNLKFLWNVT